MAKAASRKAGPLEAETESKTIAVMLAEPPAHFNDPKSQSVNVNAQLQGETALAFVRLRDGLRAANARLNSGKPVWTYSESLRWLMEQITEAE